MHIKNNKFFDASNGKYIYCTYFTRKDGTRVYAKDYGKKAFRFWINN